MKILQRIELSGYFHILFFYQNHALCPSKKQMQKWKTQSHFGIIKIYYAMMTWQIFHTFFYYLFVGFVLYVLILLKYLSVLHKFNHIAFIFICKYLALDDYNDDLFKYYRQNWAWCDESENISEFFFLFAWSIYVFVDSCVCWKGCVLRGLFLLLCLMLTVLTHWFSYRKKNWNICKFVLIYHYSFDVLTFIYFYCSCYGQILEIFFDSTIFRYTLSNWPIGLNVNHRLETIDKDVSFDYTGRFSV